MAFTINQNFLKNIEDLIGQFENMLENDLYSVFLGDLDVIDSRVTSNDIYINDACVIIYKTDQRSFEYYGGFEYVKGDFKIIFGDWIIYKVDKHNDNCRVKNLIDKIKEHPTCSDDFDN